MEENKPIEETVEKEPVRHEVKDPDIAMEKANMSDLTDCVLFPTSDMKLLDEAADKISNLPPKALDSVLTPEEKNAIVMGLESARTTISHNVFLESISKNMETLVNVIKYGDQTLTPRELKFSRKAGDVSGKAAVALFTSTLGIGNVVQIPLWHSGFWVTIRPPKNQDIVSLELAIAENSIRLGRSTNTLIYSNYSVVFNRILMDFIVNHMVDTTLKLDDAEDDIRNHIVVHDFYPLVLGVLQGMFPDGIPITKTCVNTLKFKEDNKTPLCDFVAKGKTDPSLLLFPNYKDISKNMMETMSKRTPNSVTVNEANEYKLSIKNLKEKKFSVNTKNNDGSVEFTLRIPKLYDYLNRGEEWINNIIKLSEEIFSETDSIESKRDKIEAILATVALGSYNSYVTEIKYGESTVTDPSTITDVLEVMTSDANVNKILLKEIREYIGNSYVALVGTPVFECPKCKAPQTEEGNGLSKSFKEFIPINVIESFFDLCVLRIMTLRRQNIY